MLLANLAGQMACGFLMREEREKRRESESCLGQNNLGLSKTLRFPDDAVLASTC